MAIPVIMPKLEMAQETATVVEWLKQEGEEVEKDEPLLVVETDKITVDIESPASGILAGVRAGPADVVPVTEIIAYLLKPGETMSQEMTAAPPPLSASAAVQTVPTTAGTRATPAARRIARERTVDLRTITGSGPHGRVQAADVLTSTITPERPEQAAEVIPLQGIRRTSAQRLTASYQEIPHVYFTMRVDMGEFEKTRAALNARDPRVSITALLVKAVAWALKRHPGLNSTLRGTEIHLLPEINVGVAVALEEGLIVPVVQHADLKSVAEIARRVNELVTRAREGQLTPTDVAGGTFTLSNLGPFGIEQFTAIINPPQVAILAVGATRPEAIVSPEGQIVIRPVFRMTLAADHRVVDGALAARFLVELREVLENPTLLLW
ncbi:MAG: dihydrolipoamide acetyltransferase family protein [Chloroflexota bacterium]|nr:dihydrolipoamide acetyltransferase family protein [Chloroflexota bacterium]